MYAKIFASLFKGTLRGKAHEILVFTYLLANAEKDSQVDVHPKAIADDVGLTREQVDAAIKSLESPDEDSRSPDYEGRRLLRLDAHRSWGWHIVNHRKYREIQNKDDKRAYDAEAQRRRRERIRAKKDSTKNVTGESCQENIDKSLTVIDPSTGICVSVSPVSSSLGEESREGVPVDPERAWSMERLNPWARELVAEGCKIGPKNWQRWKKLVLDHSQAQVVSYAKGISAEVRWPDRVETALAKAMGQPNNSDAVKAKTQRIKL